MLRIYLVCADVARATDLAALIAERELRFDQTYVSQHFEAQQVSRILALELGMPESDSVPLFAPEDRPPETDDRAARAIARILWITPEEAASVLLVTSLEIGAAIIQLSNTFALDTKAEPEDTASTARYFARCELVPLALAE